MLEKRIFLQMLTKETKKRLRKFKLASQDHLQFLRMEKWKANEIKNTDEEKILDLRISEVSKNIETIYRKLNW